MPFAIVQLFHSSPLLSPQFCSDSVRIRARVVRIASWAFGFLQNVNLASIVASQPFWLFAEKSSPMASTLLNCSICPKHPTFSDTSHLLTHVSSKGHLSHLHRLQVRSQQEISASNQLAAYDQWYSHHDLGRLLSERMLQKEAKISKGRRKFPRSPRLIKKEQASGTRNAISGNQFLTIDPGLYRTPATRVAKTRVSGGNPFRVDEDSDFDSSPVKKHT